MAKKRTELYPAFKKGAIPKESDFKDLIDSMLNQEDDGVFKTGIDPLSINAVGTEEGLLNFYRLDDKGEKQSSWQLKQKPGGKPGLSIHDAAGPSRLFIESGTGNVGIGTPDPGGKVQIINQNQDSNGNTLILGPTNQSNLRLGYDAKYSWIQSHGNKPLAINAVSSDVGIGTTDPKSKLSVSGGLAVGSTYAGANAAPADGLLVQGNVGIGTTKIKTRFHASIGKGGTDDPAGVFQVENCGKPCGQPEWTEALRLWNSNANGRVGLGLMVDAQGDLASVPNVYLGTTDNSANNNFQIATKENGILTPRLVIDGSSGNVGIGTTARAGTLEVLCGGSGAWNKLVVTPTSEWGDANASYVTIGAGGAAGIMLSNPYVTWRNSQAAIRYGRSGGVANGAYWDVGLRAGNAFSFAINGNTNHKVWIDESGNVGIGLTDVKKSMRDAKIAPIDAQITANESQIRNFQAQLNNPILRQAFQPQIDALQRQIADLQRQKTRLEAAFEAGGHMVVQGDIYGRTKNFLIAHPSDPQSRLCHASLEGPENGVYYRGTADLRNGTATVVLPTYFEALTRKEDRTVTLTAKGKEPFLLSSEDVVDGRFTVYGTKSNGEFSWEVKAVRADVDRLIAELPAGASANHRNFRAPAESMALEYETNSPN